MRDSLDYNAAMIHSSQTVARNRVVPTLMDVIFVVSGLLAAGAAQPAESAEWRVEPSRVVLATPESSVQLLVTRIASTGHRIDRTRSVEYSVADPSIVTVSARGRVEARAAGATRITVRHDGRTVDVPVDARRLQNPPPVSFTRDIIPILSKAGCNSGSCHGKAEGQNGFQLSVFGFDASADHSALVKEGRGRRVSLAAPAHSLLLQKASGRMPHGGGVKIRAGSRWDRLLTRWIAEGARAGVVADLELEPRIEHIEVAPEVAVLAPDMSQQLQVVAIDSSGQRRDVTAEAEFVSNMDAIAGVDREGLVSVTGVPGEAAILVRYVGHVAVARITLPQLEVEFQRPPEHNFIDRLVWDRLETLGIAPSPLADDGTFLRRASLDLTGTLPTVAETRRFLDDPNPDKRMRRVNALLERTEHAEFHAMLWADILRVDSEILTPQGALAMTRWLRRQLRENRPYDEFVREIVTARGSTLSESPAGFFVVHDKPDEMARAVSQVFLGVRIECAQCHHHPFERWGQQDYFALAGFFSGVSKQPNPLGGQKIVASGGADLQHPRTGQAVPAAGLGADSADFRKLRDRREALFEWMVAPENPYFARTLANRLWAHYFGRGLVEPIDDLRATNPASNEPLLHALSEHLRELDFDIKAFTRTLLSSRAYQLSAAANDSNRLDAQNFSHAAWRPLPAEVLLDAICQATGVPEHFNGWPTGYRAVQVWDNRVPSYFLRTFGRPARVSVCACERGSEPSMAQVLHLMNSRELVAKIRHRDGRARQLADSDRTPEDIVEALYLATLCRSPGSAERRLMRRAFAESPSRRQAAEDVLWTLLNTREFVYNH